MVTVVMEREFERTHTAEDMHAAAHAGRSCLELYGVRPRRHYLARDGMRCTCVFDAADAEAMRNVIRTSGLQFPMGLWSSTIHPAPGEGADGPPILNQASNALALVERQFNEPVAFEDIQAQEDRASHCLKMHRVRFLRSYFSTDRRRMVCLYEAPDVEAVRLANRQAGLPFEVAWGAEVVISD
jgi:hypothetical protein